MSAKNSDYKWMVNGEEAVTKGYTGEDWDHFSQETKPMPLQDFKKFILSFYYFERKPKT